MIKQFLLPCILILFGLNALAQQAKPVAIVLADTISGTRLPGVTIRIKRLNKNAVTDSSGQASLNLKPGSYTFSFSHVGYQSKQLTAIITDTTTALGVKLQSRITVLNDVTVAGLNREQEDAKTVKRSVMPVTVITGAEIENRASNLNDILARQAGVQVKETGGLGSESHISVRGLEGKRVAIYIDGNPLNSPDGSLNINDIPLQFIERIEIYKGTVPAYLGGDGLGSAVNIIIKHRNLNYFETDLGYQSFNTRKLQIAGKHNFENSGVEVGGGFVYAAAANDYQMQSPYQPGLTITRNHDQYLSDIAGLSLRFTKLWFDEVELEGIWLHNEKQVQGIQYDIQQAHSYGSSGVFSLVLKKNNLLNGKLNLNDQFVIIDATSHFIDTSHYQYDFNGNSTRSLTGQGEIGLGPNTTVTPQHEVRQRFNANYKLSKVFSLNLNNTFGSARINPSDSIANRYAGRNLYNYPGSLMNTVTGLTLEGSTVHDKLLFSIALKNYYYKATGYNTSYFQVVTPNQVSVSTDKTGYNAGVRYNFTDAFLIKGSYEKAIRLPLPGELFGDGSLISPAINLQPEQANNYSLGLVYDKFKTGTNRIQLESNVFYMDVNNLIQLGGIAPLTEYQNYAKANIMGADADLKFDLTPAIYLNTNVTYQRLTDKLRYIPGTENVPNPTYNLQLPNVAPFFINWGAEFHRANLLGKGTKTRIIYEGSYVHKFYYGFKYNDNNESVIPGYNTHNLIWEQSFHNQRYTITAEARNITNQNIIDEFNNPLPGRSYLLRLRFLLLGKSNKS